ncbi:cupin domain-containing protein [Allokutzneria multivorans]|uniref:Cupin domain-containing protein n=1 Tax=Allokutzneria multivorans TaxID=1142134 RepID=A0ABP7TQU4_9PSEU
MTEWKPLRVVEGLPLLGGEGRYRVRSRSEHGVLLEITYPAGVASPVHSHDHDSHVHLMSGHVTGTLGGEAVELRAGEVVVHPRGVPHSVVAVTGSTWLEFKSPPTIPLA